MLRESLKLKPEFVGVAFYEGLGNAPRSVDGKPGKYQRHILNSPVHGIFHVITEATAEVFPFDCQVKVIEPLFYPDRNVNGTSVAPALNVLAKGLEIVKGGK